MRVDYRALGLRVGLELHIQLDSPRKLFCHCPPVIRSDEPHFRIKRVLRVSLSELGEVDPAAAWEVRKRRVFVYEGYYDTTCLVELDEEPPHEVDEHSLETAVAVARMFNAELLDEVQVMRKIVVDGSNVSGFQRTMLIAVGGLAKILGYKVPIQTIVLEEDAARKIEEKGNVVVYRLDRLGIPLVEIATAPLELSPREVEEVAMLIGYSVKATGRAKRGVGTVRQDVNVSIVGGAKTEIKGVPTLSLIPKVVEYEVMRQLNLLKIRDELRSRGVREEDLVEDYVDVTDVFSTTKSRLIAGVVGKGGKVVALKAPGFNGVLGFEIQPGRRFGSELADRVKAWTNLGGLVHSDELPGYGISSDEKRRVEERLGSSSFILLAGLNEEELREAVGVVVERLRQALRGVPEETRGAAPNGTTYFMRPRPGAARMYPETDILPLRITPELVRRVEPIACTSLDSKVAKLMGIGLGREQAMQLVRSPHLDLFEELVERYPGVPPTVIATFVLSTLKQLHREGLEPSEEQIMDVFSAYSLGHITKEAIPDVLREVVRTGTSAVESAKRIGLIRLSYEKVKEIVLKYLKEVKSADKVFGLVMRDYRGRVEAEDVRRALEELSREREDF